MIATCDIFVPVENYYCKVNLHIPNHKNISDIHNIIQPPKLFIQETPILSIVGSKSFDNEDILKKYFKQWVKEYGYPKSIVSGDDSGISIFAENIARSESIKFEKIENDWFTHGSKSGSIQNTDIVKHCTHIIIICPKNQKSKKCRDLIKKSKKENKIIKIHLI